MALTAVFVMQAVGVAAALCSTASFVPQVVKMWRDKAGESVSLRMYVLTVTGFTLWSVYGVLLASWPLVASNLISLALSSAILLLKLRYRDRPADRANLRPASRRAAQTTGPT
jgi:MtN3 and saliva related transmembrane protein